MQSRTPMTTLSRAEIQMLADSGPGWYHSIDLGQGVVTKGRKHPATLQCELDLLELGDLGGKKVLDIGAWDGYFSFAAERHGAKSVLSVDHYAWSIDRNQLSKVIEESRRQGLPLRSPHFYSEVWDPIGLPGKYGYDTAHGLLNSRAEPFVADFMTLDPASIGIFDVVLFLGVLYHLENPVGALRVIRQLTRGRAYIETEAFALRGSDVQPACMFFEYDERANDPTNWFVPNLTAIMSMCRAVGFPYVMSLTVPPLDHLLTPNVHHRYRVLVVASDEPVPIDQSSRLMFPLGTLVPSQCRLRIVESPCEVRVGSSFDATVEVSNNSPTILCHFSPHPINFSYHWLRDGDVAVFEGDRSPLWPPVERGQRRDYQVRVLAPPGPGDYVLRITLVQEMIRWLDEAPSHWFIDVPIRVITD